MKMVHWEQARWGLWTGAIVSYAWPFKKSPHKVSDRWERFGDEPDLRAVHRTVIDLRDQLFAHSDETPHREVVVRRRDADEDRTQFNSPLQIVRFRQLCRFQLDRLTARIDQWLVALDAEGLLADEFHPLARLSPSRLRWHRRSGADEWRGRARVRYVRELQALATNRLALLVVGTAGQARMQTKVVGEPQLPPPCCR